MSEREPIDLRTTLHRRKLLGGLGALTVALTSPIWRSATVFGQDANVKAAKRFIGIFSANGTIAKSFFKDGAGSEIALDTLSPILAPLEAHKDKLLVLKGLEEFREHLGGKLTIKILQGVGRGFEVHEMESAVVHAAIQELHERHKLRGSASAASA